MQAAAEAAAAEAQAAADEARRVAEKEAAEAAEAAAAQAKEEELAELTCVASELEAATAAVRPEAQAEAEAKAKARTAAEKSARLAEVKAKAAALRAAKEAREQAEATRRASLALAGRRASVEDEIKRAMVPAPVPGAADEPAALATKVDDEERDATRKASSALAEKRASVEDEIKQAMMPKAAAATSPPPPPVPLSPAFRPAALRTTASPEPGPDDVDDSGAVVGNPLLDGDEAGGGGGQVVAGGGGGDGGDAVLAGSDADKKKERYAFRGHWGANLASPSKKAMASTFVPLGAALGERDRQRLAGRRRLSVGEVVGIMRVAAQVPNPDDSSDPVGPNNRGSLSSGGGAAAAVVDVSFGGSVPFAVAHLFGDLCAIDDGDESPYGDRSEGASSDGGGGVEPRRKSLTGLHIRSRLAAAATSLTHKAQAGEAEPVSDVGLSSLRFGQFLRWRPVAEQEADGVDVAGALQPLWLDAVGATPDGDTSDGDSSDGNRPDGVAAKTAATWRRGDPLPRASLRAFNRLVSLLARFRLAETCVDEDGPDDDEAPGSGAGGPVSPEAAASTLRFVADLRSRITAPPSPIKASGSTFTSKADAETEDAVVGHPVGHPVEIDASGASMSLEEALAFSANLSAMERRATVALAAINKASREAAGAAESESDLAASGDGDCGNDDEGAGGNDDNGGEGDGDGSGGDNDAGGCDDDADADGGGGGRKKSGRTVVREKVVVVREETRTVVESREGLSELQATLLAEIDKVRRSQAAQEQAQLASSGQLSAAAQELLALKAKLKAVEAAAAEEHRLREAAEAERARLAAEAAERERLRQDEGFFGAFGSAVTSMFGSAAETVADTAKSASSSMFG